MQGRVRHGVLAALLLVLLPAAALAQDTTAALRKSDLIRYLTGTTYSKPEIAAIVSRSCLAFAPTDRDLADLRQLGATDAILGAIGECASNRRQRVASAQRTAARARTSSNGDVAPRRAAPAPRPARPADLALTQSTITAPAGAIASVVVHVARDDKPVGGVRLVLRGAGKIPGGAKGDLSASTDYAGQAVFPVPAGTAPGSYQLTVAPADSVPLVGNGTVTLTTTPTRAATAELRPTLLAITPGQDAKDSVRVVVRDPFGNPVAHHVVELRPEHAREGLSHLSLLTNDSGSVVFQIPTGPLRDGDSFAVTVEDRSLATLRVSTAPALARSNMAAGRSAPLLLDAARLTTNGRLAEAEAVYDSVLQADPNNLAARLGRGYIRSWQHRYEPAREDFLAVLRADSSNVAALTGLGYNNAWTGRYERAEQRFGEALHIVPGQIDADKGLAYVALWSGDTAEAVKRFEGVTKRHPRDAEAAVGLGQSLLQAGEMREARDAFTQAIRLDPERADAKQGLHASRAGIRRIFEVTAWGGYSSLSASDQPVLDTPAPGFPDITSDEGASGLGLRFAELAASPNPSLRFWLQYDNGLSLDNLSFVRSSEGAPSYYLGGYGRWGGYFTTRLETGWRSLPGDVSQRLYRGEQAVDFPSTSATLKVGGWVGPRSDDLTEWLAYTALGFGLGPRFRLEPAFFYAKSGVPGESQHRELVYGEYRFDNGWQLGSGIAIGQAHIVPGAGIEPPIDDRRRGGPGQEDDSGGGDTGIGLVAPIGVEPESQGLWDAYLLASAPFAGTQRVHLLLRRQSIDNGSSLVVAALGVTLGF